MSEIAANPLTPELIEDVLDRLDDAIRAALETADNFGRLDGLPSHEDDDEAAEDQWELLLHAATDQVLARLKPRSS